MNLNVTLPESALANLSYFSAPDASSAMAVHVGTLGGRARMVIEYAVHLPGHAEAFADMIYDIGSSDATRTQMYQIKDALQFSTYLAGMGAGQPLAMDFGAAEGSCVMSKMEKQTTEPGVILPVEKLRDYMLPVALPNRDKDNPRISWDGIEYGGFDLSVAGGLLLIELTDPLSKYEFGQLLGVAAFTKLEIPPGTKWEFPVMSTAPIAPPAPMPPVVPVAASPAPAAPTPPTPPTPPLAGPVMVQLPITVPGGVAPTTPISVGVTNVMPMVPAAAGIQGISQAPTPPTPPSAQPVNPLAGLAEVPDEQVLENGTTSQQMSPQLAEKVKRHRRTKAQIAADNAAAAAALTAMPQDVTAPTVTSTPVPVAAPAAVVLPSAPSIVVTTPEASCMAASATSETVPAPIAAAPAPVAPVTPVVTTVTAPVTPTVPDMTVPVATEPAPQTAAEAEAKRTRRSSAQLDQDAVDRLIGRKYCVLVPPDTLIDGADAKTAITKLQETVRYLASYQTSLLDAVLGIALKELESTAAPATPALPEELHAKLLQFLQQSK